MEQSKSFSKSQERHEGELTHQLEEQTSKISSANWLGLAIGSMAASATIALLSKRKDMANFVGLWAPSFLLIGIYNKLVKIEKAAMPEQFDSRAA